MKLLDTIRTIGSIASQTVDAGRKLAELRGRLATGDNLNALSTIDEVLQALNQVHQTAAIHSERALALVASPASMMNTVQSIQAKICRTTSANGSVFQTPRDQEGVRFLDSENANRDPFSLSLAEFDVLDTLPEALAVGRDITLDEVLLEVINAAGASGGPATKIFPASLLIGEDVGPRLDSLFHNIVQMRPGQIQAETQGNLSTQSLAAAAARAADDTGAASLGNEAKVATQTATEAGTLQPK